MTRLTHQTVADLMTLTGVGFGTSGARGLANAMADRVCYSYTRAFVSYLAEIGEFKKGGSIALAGDLRPSTPRILRACSRAIRDAGGTPVYCGLVPTPAVACFALERGIASLMVTGSHIPADRNGIKFYRPCGEVLKSDEAGIMRQAIVVDESDFATDGSLYVSPELGMPVDVLVAYLDRYVNFFGADALRGSYIGVYQHSAVGRDVLVSILEALGAQVRPLGRSDTFVPVDTEAVRPEDEELARNWAREFGFDAIASTDGDSDRPLLASRRGEWLRGDILAILCAAELKCSYVITPVSSNTALEKSGWFTSTRRTRIGSPYVIAAMNEAIAEGQGSVCGYEANGGFLVGTDVKREGRSLKALPTRDAVLPIVAALVGARMEGLDALVGRLPQRCTFSDRVQDFPQMRSVALFSWLAAGSELDRLHRIERLFGLLAGKPVSMDLTDGVRCNFDSGLIVHFRASGNAPELRCYTEATDEETARKLNRACLAVILQLPMA